jgi:class 3 adenylate cyclase
MAKAQAKRRLAAILAVDVAGYSRLMAADEEGTHTALKTYGRDVVDPKISKHHGHIVKNTGDGALVEFASAVDAVRCAVDIQRAMAKRNADISQGHRVEFRIGINVGDVIMDDGDIYGDGVNIAARLESLAETGGICISRQVYEPVEGKLSFIYRPLGPQKLKNIPKTVETYAINFDRVVSLIQKV